MSSKSVFYIAVVGQYNPSLDGTKLTQTGLGGVGKCFLAQLQQLSKRFEHDQRRPELRLVFVSTSNKAIYSSDYKALSYDHLEADLLQSTQNPLSLQKLIDFLAAAPAKSVFVDCTSSQVVADAYPQCLSRGVNIVTPNKKPFSASYKLWREIFEAAASSGAKVYHESSVGAGLPVISTLKELIETGDEVTKIEGVFSGTMSYLFNSFAPAKGAGKAWSSEVTTAKELGYTEPDPRDDLNGMDVARKLIILARKVGLEIESTEDIPIQSLIPKELESAANAEEFMQRLPDFDTQMEELKVAAERAGKLVRFVGGIDVSSKIVKVGLESVDRSHPIAALTGSNNIISFHTKRYGPNPLTIQGAGAGGAVTAMGITGDLIKVIDQSF